MGGNGGRDCSGYGCGCESRRSSGRGRRGGEEVVRILVGRFGGRNGGMQRGNYLRGKGMMDVLMETKE